MTDTIPPLLPCPRCGSEDICNTGHYVQCETCGMREGDYYPIPKYIQAAAQWNRLDRTETTYTYDEARTEIDRLRARIKELEGE